MKSLQHIVPKKVSFERTTPLIKAYLHVAMTLPINEQTLTISRLLKELSRLRADESTLEKIKQIEYAIRASGLINT